MKMVILMLRRMRMMTIIKGKLFADKKHLKRKREGWPLLLVATPKKFLEMST